MYKNLARPANWQDFERLICALYERKYGMTASSLYGRHGQAQNGVDIYFKDIISKGNENVAIQCKRYNIGTLDTTIIDREHAKVKKFPNKVDKFIIITTDTTNTEVQDYAWTKTNPKCEVIAWESVESDIQMYHDILQGFYKEFLIYRNPGSTGNAQSQYFVIDFSGTKIEFLISKIPSYDGKYSNQGFLLNLQTNKSTYYPVRNKHDLLGVFKHTYDAFAVFSFLNQFKAYSFFSDPSIGHSVFLNKQQIQDETNEYEYNSKKGM